jgi:hypothetical protein
LPADQAATADLEQDRTGVDAVSLGRGLGGRLSASFPKELATMPNLEETGTAPLQTPPDRDLVRRHGHPLLRDRILARRDQDYYTDLDWLYQAQPEAC